MLKRTKYIYPFLAGIALSGCDQNVTATLYPRLFRASIPCGIISGASFHDTPKHPYLPKRRRQLPEASLDWLDYVEKCDRWSELLHCHVAKEHEDLTDVRVLESTVRWLEHLKDNGPVPPGTTLETTGGDTDPKKSKT